MRARLLTIAMAAAGVLVALHRPWLVSPGIEDYFSGRGATLGLRDLFSGQLLPSHGTAMGTGWVASLAAAAATVLALLAARSPRFERVARAAGIGVAYAVAACALEAGDLRDLSQRPGGGVGFGIAFCSPMRWGGRSRGAPQPVSPAPRHSSSLRSPS